MININSHEIKAILFDFDGTLSTFRQGWERVMYPLMLEYIMGDDLDKEPFYKNMIADYIDVSTGIQTVYQMQWLCEMVEKYQGKTDIDPWGYKEIYNTRLMESVAQKVLSVQNGEVSRENYLMRGSVEFLQALQANNVDIYVASGTDHEDVINEATALGVIDYFKVIKGAPKGVIGCSKEAVMADILNDSTINTRNLAVIGDGKVEIKLGKEKGTYAIGIASDEEKRHGINLVKKIRLQNAGADMIIGDFTELL